MSSPSRTSAPPPAEIFISYSTKDRMRAVDLGRVFEAYGWTVWLDRWRLLVGQRYQDKIDEALANAKAVVVLWSEHSVRSSWVLDEAADAQKRGTIIPVRLDGCTLPKPFGVLHTADLSDWDGTDFQTEEFLALLKSIAELMRTELPEDAPKPRGRLVVVTQVYGPVLLSAVLIALIASWFVPILGLSPLLGAGVPILGGVLLFLLHELGRLQGLRRRLAEAACGRWGLSVLGALALVLSCFPAVALTGVRFDLEARLLDGPTARPIRKQALRPGKPSVRWLVFTPPWGRKVRIELDGHLPFRTTLYPWNGVAAAAGPGESIQPRPALLVRLHRNHIAKRNGATLKVERDGVTIAKATLTADQGSLLVAGQDAERQGVWRRELAGFPADRASDWAGQLAGVPADPAVLTGPWSNPACVDWSNAPPDLDAEITIRLTTAGEIEYSSQVLKLNGAVTDVEPVLNRRP